MLYIGKKINKLSKEKQIKIVTKYLSEIGY